MYGESGEYVFAEVSLRGEGRAIVALVCVAVGVSVMCGGAWAAVLRGYAGVASGGGACDVYGVWGGCGGTGRLGAVGAVAVLKVGICIRLLSLLPCPWPAWKLVVSGSSCALGEEPCTVGCARSTWAELITMCWADDEDAGDEVWGCGVAWAGAAHRCKTCMRTRRRSMVAGLGVAWGRSGGGWG